MPSRDSLHFAPIVNFVASLMRVRARGPLWHDMDVALSAMVLAQGHLLYRIGGRRLLDRAIIYISRHVGPQAAEATIALLGEIVFWELMDEETERE